MTSRFMVPGSLFILFVLALGMASGCSKTSAEKDPPPAQMTQTAAAAKFAPYQDYPVNVQPAVPAYKVSADLSNITNIERFSFSPDAKALLVQNAFVVEPGRAREFFEIYEPNRYDGIPNFISSDSMLHNYHLFFNHLLRTLEKNELTAQLKVLNASLLDQSVNLLEQMRGSAWENAARRNLAFFAVGSRLLDPYTPIPAPVQTVVEQELALINRHQETAISPVMNLGATVNALESLQEDYTQYIPRGHYDSSEELKNYFKAMMWYGRMTFRISNEDETRSAALITLMLTQNDALKSWDNIYASTSFFSGQSDDLNFNQYSLMLKEAYGGIPSASQLTGDEVKWKDFMARAHNLPAPAINSIPIYDENIQPDRESAIKGFRLMGQRFTLDAAIFQHLIYREVKENQAGERRMLPKGLDIPAAMGSAEAYKILQESGDTAYQNYPENMAKIKNYITGLGRDQWTQNLYWGWLYTIQPLTAPKPEGYPSFMTNQAWTRKELNSFLGSWTELKHDTILYSKGVYAEAGGGGEARDDRGYVEPNPYIYGRLASLSAMTREGLASRSLLAANDRDSLVKLQELALILKTISEKELSNSPLSDQEYELIRSFGAQLEHFWLEALRDKGVETRSELFDNPAALVADVATAPGVALEEGTGYISTIYAVVPVEGELRVAMGGVYSYYEFAWPATNRLSDKEWQQQLSSDQNPAMPGWTSAFITPGDIRVIPVWE